MSAQSDLKQRSFSWRKFKLLQWAEQSPHLSPVENVGQNLSRSPSHLIELELFCKEELVKYKFLLYSLQIIVQNPFHFPSASQLCPSVTTFVSLVKRKTHYGFERYRDKTCHSSTDANTFVKHLIQEIWRFQSSLNVSVPQTKYKQIAEMDRASYTTVIDTPDIIHAQQMRNIVSQVRLPPKLTCESVFNSPARRSICSCCRNRKNTKRKLRRRCLTTCRSWTLQRCRESVRTRGTSAL